VSLVVDPRLGPICLCGGPVRPGHDLCGACTEEVIGRERRRAYAEMPGGARKLCARFPACTAHVPRNNDEHCSRACTSIASSERILARLEANGVPTKRTRKEMARG